MTGLEERFQNLNVCLCGCGNIVTFYRGKFRKFFHGHNMRNKRNIRKGYVIVYGIYKKILRPHHKNADKRGYVYEHRYRKELELGRYLDSNETVHHISRELDQDGLLNNDENNLMLFNSHSEHIKYERKNKKWNRYYKLPI